jgi:hypothetical protein
MEVGEVNGPAAAEMQPSSIPLCPRPSLAASQRPGLAPTLIQMSKLRVDRDDEFWRGHWPHWQRKSSRHSQWRAGRARRQRKAAPIGGQRTGKRFRLRCRPRAAAKARCTLLELVSRPHRHAGDRAGAAAGEVVEAHPSSTRRASHCARRGRAAATIRPARGGERNIDKLLPQQRRRPHRCGCNWSGEWSVLSVLMTVQGERPPGGPQSAPRKVPGGPTRMGVAFASCRAERGPLSRAPICPHLASEDCYAGRPMLDRWRRPY